MSDYYYLNEDPDLNPILGDDYISALYSISKKHGINITDEMILKEVWGNKFQKKYKERINLYIDGTNLFAGQNELFGPKKHLSFEFLIKEINKLVRVDEIYFYASYMNRKNHLTSRLKDLIAAEALFYREVIHTRNVTFYKGHRSPTSGKEKGVDVHLSVDIVKDAFLKRCNQIVVMTGDADLIYPLEVVKLLKIPTIAFFLPNRFSLEMAYKVDKAFVLNFGNKFRADRKLPKQLKVIAIKKPRMINIRGK